MNVVEYQNLAEYLYQKTGIKFEDAKYDFVRRRVEERIKKLGFKSFREYFFHLKYGDKGEEFQLLINSLTINETYFFREYPQLKCFAEEVIPELIQKKTVKHIKVWSAGCSTGEEPYTLAIILKEMLEGTGFTFQVDATDINSRVIEYARKRLYTKRSVKDVPNVYLAKYFLPRGEVYELSAEIARYVNFQLLNLLDEKAMNRMSGYDAIFCRNVLIYFDDKSRREVALHFYRALNPGGYIFLGHSESMSRITSVFKLKKFKNAIIYQKPEA
ncbi:chemotaxis protein [Carboxydothermus islandicus]|uniref:protein-glutamate O-methyltransferase n=1 Tax=Carboxydothermus islandicus TaxID=661089 RepID=A0A1L8D503_9THEO|nr:CheR family methyltransferase [Carboxydothermus islandicus]GAV26194.1 chemotaxis protein [Carboxydothermus islandicus]